jgi:hypothetical protein
VCVFNSRFSLATKDVYYRVRGVSKLRVRVYINADGVQLGSLLCSEDQAKDLKRIFEIYATRQNERGTRASDRSSAGPNPGPPGYSDSNQRGRSLSSDDDLLESFDPKPPLSGD